jgi:hypothetical protein
MCGVCARECVRWPALGLRFLFPRRVPQQQQQMDMVLCLDDGKGQLVLGGLNASDVPFPTGEPTTLDTTTTTLPCTNYDPPFGKCVLC